jgi:NADH-ubiquinone oxidoreductase chain 5
MLGGLTTKILDKGSVELFGPFGMENLLLKISKNISSLSSGIVTTYALFILISFIIYLFMYNLLYIYNINYELLNIIYIISIFILY